MNLEYFNASIEIKEFYFTVVLETLLNQVKSKVVWRKMDFVRLNFHYFDLKMEYQMTIWEVIWKVWWK